MSSLKDKVIIITGGTSGIGESCTELFARSGAKVVTASIQEKEGKVLAEKLTGEGHQCIFQYSDASKEDDVKALVGLAVDEFGRLDAVFANAGVLRNEKITEITLDDFHQILNVNLLGPVLISKYAVSVMEKQGKGCICFNTSMGAYVGFPEHAVYCASKAALVALMRCLTTEHSPKGVRFVGVSPGDIDTPMLAASCEVWGKPKEVLYPYIAKKIPAQRMGQPIDVAHTVAFLLSDEAGFINGSVVHVEGGILCLPPW